MATNRRKDAATLYEVLGRMAAKSQKKEVSTPSAPGTPPTATPVTPPTIPTIHQHTPPRLPITASIRPPPDASHSTIPSVDIHKPAAPMQSPNEPVLLDQILARFRPWILVATAGIVAVVLAMIIIISTNGPKSRMPAAPVIISSGTPTPTQVQPQLLPENGNTAAPTPSPSILSAHKPAVHVGRVIPAMQVTRSANRWYLVILTTLPQYAQRAAEFIARHGVSVTIENGPHNFKCVIAVRGFKHRAGAAAIAFRRKVVHIGTLLPDARRAGRSDFNTAYYAHVQRSE